MIGGTHDTIQGQMVAAWFAEKADREQYPPFTALGWLNGQDISCAALFTDYQSGGNIELHLIGRLRRNVIRDVLHYAFNTARAARITAKPYRSNEMARDALVRFGFTLEGVLKHYYGWRHSEDAIVYRLDRRNAKKWMI